MKGGKPVQMQERKTMLRTVCMLSWPTVLEQALQTGAQYVDTAMVGRIGMQASAAVGLTASAMWLITGPLAAIGMGVLSCISKAIGAEDRQKAGIACNQTVLLTLATGVLFGAIALGISPFLPDWLGAGREIRRDAFRYFFITSLPMVFRAAAVIFGAAIRATGNTRTPMKITAISLLVNISLNYFLISPSRVLFLGPLRFHIWGGGLGVTGAAVATALAYVLNGVLMFAALGRSPYFRICGEGNFIIN